MKTKTIPCPVCDGRGYVLWTSATDQSCSTGSKVCPHCQGAGNREVPQTNADRIRAMSDEELAKFLAAKFSDLQSQQLFGESSTPTAIELSALAHKLYCQWMYWLRQPVKDGENDG